jgi:hypothetical protein
MAKLNHVLAEAIAQALPARSQKEIAARTRLTLPQVGVALGHIRDHAAELGWTVPHAPRGRSQPNRYFLILFDDTSAVFDEEEQATLQGGLAGTLRGVNTTGKREAAALRMAFPLYEANDPVFAREIREIEETLSFVARRAEGALRRLVDAETG